MRTYDIIDDASGVVIATQQCEDTMAPVRLSGQSAKLTHIDGAPAIQGEPLTLTDAERAALPTLVPADQAGEMATSVGERPDDAHPGAQLAPSGGLPPAT